MGTGLLGLQDVTLYVTEINTEQAQRPISPTSIAGQLAWKYNKSAPVGQKIVDTVPFFGNQWKKRSVYEMVNGTMPTVVQFSLETSLWSPDAEIIGALTKLSDIYGIVKDNSATLLAQGEIEMERQFAELIALGLTVKTDYDQLTFFNTAHEANPLKAGFKTFSNYKAGRSVTGANIQATLQDLAQMPGPDGNLLSMPGQIYAFCSTEAQFYTLSLYANETLVPNDAGTATQGNPLKGRFTPILIPALFGYESSKLWGMCKIASPKHRPFAVAQPMPLQISLTGIDVNDHLQVLQAAAMQKVSGAWGFGYLWPHLCVLCKET